MRNFVLAISAALLAAPPGAFADHSASQIDLYYISSGFEITVPPPDPDPGSADDSGDGFGIKGQLEFAPDLYLTGEYQSSTLDDTESDFDQMRIGVGGRAQIGLDLWGRLRGEYFDAEFDGEDFDDGFGAHAGIELELDALSIYGDVGYLWLDLSEGRSSWSALPMSCCLPSACLPTIESPRSNWTMAARSNSSSTTFASVHD